MDDKHLAFKNWWESNDGIDYRDAARAFDAGWEAAVAHYNIIDGERAEWETVDAIITRPIHVRYKGERLTCEEYLARRQKEKIDGERAEWETNSAK